jgi:hypothetical protein
MNHGFPTASCFACVKGAARTPPWKILHRSSPSNDDHFSFQTSGNTSICKLTNAPDGMAAANYYDNLLLRLIGDGELPPVAIERVAGAYLDGSEGLPARLVERRGYGARSGAIYGPGANSR